MSTCMKATAIFLWAVLWAASPAIADEAVTIGSSTASLIKPASIRASVILMPGSDGAIRVGADGVVGRMRNNSLVRNRYAYAGRGLAVLVADRDIDLAAAIAFMAQIKRPVTVLASSRGTLRAARAIANGARPDALVLASGFLSDESGSFDNVRTILGSADLLPRTLVIHHRDDQCRKTQPAGVDPFIVWAAGRARVQWLSGGAEEGDPCEAGGHHGFNGLDAQLVSLSAGFR